MSKGLKIGLIVAACLVGLVFVVGIGAAIFIPNANRFISKSRQSEAKVTLISAATYLKMEQIDSETFSDDPARAFPDAAMFACESGPCRSYILAIQKSCESGTGWNIVDASKANLHARASAREAELIAKIESLQLPCKAKETGFTIVAAGILEDGQPIDLWVAEEKGPPQSLEEYVAK